MSKIDQKYIDALNDFTRALDDIVISLKEQQKNDKADVINEFLKTPMTDLTAVVTSLKNTTVSGFKSIKNDNQKIIKNLESIKKQKESGMFDRIEDPKNKNKIVDGIKVVALIAGGVLALGMAFKIIGKVDFLSVIAISGAMMAMGFVFSQLSEIKNLKYSNVLAMSLMMPLMALGIVLSGNILKTMPNVSLMQGLSALFVGVSLGVAAYFILTSISKLSPKQILLAPMIPFLLPLVANSVVLSGNILNSMPIIGLMQGLSALFVGVSLGVAAYFILTSISKLNPKQILLAPMIPFLLPLVAYGVVLAGNILQGFKPIKNPLQLLIGSAVIGLSMLFFVPTIKLLGNMKLKDVLTSTLMVPLIAASIVISSELLQNFKTIKDPIGLVISSLSIGLSVLFFVPTVMLLGKMSTKDLLTGSLSILLVAGSILGTAYIFSLLPNTMKYPKLEWTLGAGLSLLLFSGMVAGLGLIAAFLGVFLIAGMAAILGVAATMVAVSYLMNSGKWDGNYPSLKWSLGVGTSLVLFSGAMVAASVGGIVGAVGSIFTGGVNPLVAIAQSMVDVSFLIQKGKWDGNYPSLKWALGVGTSLVLFSGAMVAASVGGVVGAIGSLFTGGVNPLVAIAQSMVDVSYIIQKGKYDGNYPSLKWALGVGVGLTLWSALVVAASAAGLVGAIGSLFTGGKDPLLSLVESMISVSFLIQKGKYDGNLPTVGWISSVTLALAAWSALVVASSTTGLVKSALGLFSGDKDPLRTLANSMVLISHLIQLGKYDGNYPKMDWVKGVGGALSIWSVLVIASSATGLLKSVFNLFSGDKDPLRAIASSMVAISHLIQLGKYDGNYPTTEWTKNVSSALISFSGMLMISGFSKMVTSILTLFSKDKDPLLKLSNSIVNVSLLLNQGKYDVYPYWKWVSGVINALTSFGNLSKSLTSIIPGRGVNTEMLLSLATTIVSISKLMEQAKWQSSIPSNKVVSALITYVSSLMPIVSNWTVSVDDATKFNNSISMFSSGLNKLVNIKSSQADASKNIMQISNSLKSLPQIQDSKVQAIIKIADAFEKMSNSLVSVNNNMSGFTTKFSSLKISKPENQLSSIAGRNEQLNVSKSTQGQTNVLSSMEKTITHTEKDKNIKNDMIIDKKQEKFYNDISEIKNLLSGLKSQLDRPSSASSFR